MPGKVHLYSKDRRTLVANYKGPDSPMVGPVIINYLDPDGRLVNMTRLHLDYETTGKVEVVHGGPVQRLNIQLDPKQKG